MTSTEFRNTVLPLKNKLFAFSLRLLNNRQEAEDVVQDVMLKIWEQETSGKAINNLEAYCMTMTRNRSLDKMKMKSYRNPALDDHLHIASDTDLPDTLTERNEMMQKMKEVIDALPERQRSVIHLRDFDGHSYQEIAEVLEIDMNLVKVTLHRARKTIKEVLNKWTRYGIQSA